MNSSRRRNITAVGPVALGLLVLALSMSTGCCRDEAAKQAAEQAAEQAVEQAALTVEEAEASLLASYLEVWDTLAKDSTEGVSAAAGNVAEVASSFARASDTEPAHKPAIEELTPMIEEHARTLAAAPDLAAAREAFKGLSVSVIRLRHLIQSQAEDVVVVYCPMKNASWLQRGQDIRNPYHGSEMLSSGRIVQTGTPAPGMGRGHVHGPDCNH